MLSGWGEVPCGANKPGVSTKVLFQELVTSCASFYMARSARFACLLPLKQHFWCCAINWSKKRMVATPSGLKPDPLSKECVCGGDGRKFWILAPHIFASKVLLVIKHIFQTPFKMVDIQYKTSSPSVDNSTMTYSIDNTWKQGRYIFHLVNHSLVHNGPHFLHVVDHIFTPSQHPTRGWRRPDSHPYCTAAARLSQTTNVSSTDKSALIQLWAFWFQNLLACKFKLRCLLFNPLPLLASGRWAGGAWGPDQVGRWGPGAQITWL